MVVCRDYHGGRQLIGRFNDDCAAAETRSRCFGSIYLHHGAGATRYAERSRTRPVWTNANFKMLYMNMGHGDKVFSSPTQNRPFENGILWLLGRY
jgi:hypothetical protein